ncbi:MAG: TPM domain-containing protein [Bdellovibrio sp.]
MTWIRRYLSNEERKRVEEAITQVEKSTAGEIVPVIVKRSSAVGHVPLTLTLLITLLIVIAEVPFSDWLWVKPWVWLWPVLVITIYYMSYVLAKIPWIQKILVSERDELIQVHQRAQLEFYNNKINRTESGTGVLIFVSVMEKKAVILADEKISKRLPENIWDQILAEFRQNLSKDRWAEGFIQAIQSCGEQLKTHFPISANPRNELKNHLVIRD